MSEFVCCVCFATFHIPERTVARYVRWVPKYCAAHRDIARARSKPWIGKHFAEAARLARQSRAAERHPGAVNPPRVVAMAATATAGVSHAAIDAAHPRAQAWQRGNSCAVRC